MNADLYTVVLSTLVNVPPIIGVVPSEA